MSEEFRVPDYTRAGFIYLAGRKKYLGFCKDVQNINKETIDQQGMNIAWFQTLKELHEDWVPSGGRRLSKEVQDGKLAAVRLQTQGPKAEKYWADLVKSTGRTDLIDDHDVAGIDFEALVNHHDTEYPEVDYDKDHTPAQLKQIFKPVYKIGNAYVDGLVEDSEAERAAIEYQVLLCGRSKNAVKVDGDMAEMMKSSNLVEDEDMMDIEQ
ncbi:hypothetical protein VTL71DRAFT_746 [Oculimacula yallundae]|uniref:Uncharacterized protein n=1 Tax=Oculimacula yallundae TaxID=86028 RepID=A0ABR4D2E8_9HELO